MRGGKALQRDTCACKQVWAGDSGRKSGGIQVKYRVKKALFRVSSPTEVVRNMGWEKAGVVTRPIRL